MDQYGQYHLWYGAHNSNLQYTYSTKPHNAAAWAAGTQITGTLTVCNAVIVNGTIYVFEQGTNSRLTYCTGTPSKSGGVSLWSSEVASRISARTPYGWLGNTVV